MPGQYQEDVIGIPFSGVLIKNSAIVVSESPQTGKRQTSGGSNDIDPALVNEKLTDRLDDVQYYV